MIFVAINVKSHPQDLVVVVKGISLLDIIKRSGERFTMKDVVIVGAGVSGLTVGYLLAKNGYDVFIMIISYLILALIDSIPIITASWNSFMRFCQLKL